MASLPALVRRMLSTWPLFFLSGEDAEHIASLPALVRRMLSTWPLFLLSS
jgi:hypothetical protein